MTELPDSYRQLQKIAGAVPEAKGNGKKEDIILSLEEADTQEVEKAKAQVLENTENTESDDKEKETSEEPSSSTENQEEEPELEYTGDRNHSGDLLGREKPEEQVLETLENGENEVELTDNNDEEEENPSTDDSSTAEPVEIDNRVFKMPHLVINKALDMVLGRKFNVEVPELSEKELDELAQDTEIVVDQNLSRTQKQNLQSQSGLIGIAVRHGKNVLSAFSDRSRNQGTSKDKEKETSEEQPEHMKNQLDDSQENVGEKFSGDWS